MRLSDIDTIPCPVARALSVIGDPWTILILRDCFKGETRFEALLASTRAPRAILSARLAQLVEAGVLERTPYGGTRRHDYSLTGKGHALQPVLMMMSHWSQTWMPDAQISRVKRRHTACGHVFKPLVVCSECGEEVKPGEVALESPLAPARHAEPVEKKKKTARRVAA
jgi:DNA-binding HxlR family transcriptional regulator